MTDQPEQRYSPFNGPAQGTVPASTRPGAKPVTLVAGGDVVLPWDTAMEIAAALQFYRRSWDREPGRDDATASISLLHDAGHLARTTLQLLPAEVLTATRTRIDEGTGSAGS